MIVHPMSMFRKESYFASGEYIGIKRGQDHLYWSRLAKFGKFKNLRTPLGAYRLLADSIDHVRNPYQQVLYELRCKMVLDDVVRQEDVALYNYICDLSKSQSFVEKGKIKRKITIEERLFALLRLPLGSNLAELIVTWLKDLYGLLKYR